MYFVVPIIHTSCLHNLFFLFALWFNLLHNRGEQKGEEIIFNHASIVNQIPLLRIQRALVYTIYLRPTKKQPDGDILRLNTSYTTCSVQSKQQSSRKVNSSQQFQWSSSPSVCEQTQSVEPMSSHCADVSISPMFDWWASMPSGADYQEKVGPPTFHKANWGEWLSIFFINSLWTCLCNTWSRLNWFYSWYLPASTPKLTSSTHILNVRCSVWKLVCLTGLNVYRACNSA